MAVQIVPSSFEELRMITELDRAAFGVDRWNYLDFISVLQDPSAKSFTAYADGDFAGFASVYEEEGEVWISTIAVASEKQGKGIGSALLDRCEKAFKTRFVFLNADETNKELLQFYQKRGYYPIEHWERYYQSGHDSVVMLKELHEE